MKIGFKFPEVITENEIRAFRNYQERLQPIMEAYRRKVDALNANYDKTLMKLGSEYEESLSVLSQQHDVERLAQATKTRGGTRYASGERTFKRAHDPFGCSRGDYMRSPLEPNNRG